MGEEAGDVLSTTEITDKERKKYETVMEKHDGFFKVHRNVIFECVRFNRRYQRAGETAEQYITVLYGLIETCEYGTLKNDLLRDRLVVGIAHQALSKKLQLMSDLTLDKAKTLIRQQEAVHDQQQELTGNGSKKNPIVVDAVGGADRSKTRRNRQPQRFTKDKQNQQGGAGSTTCKRCGKTHKLSDKCPARGATCYRCNRKGHFGSQCLSKTVGETTSKDPELNTLFIGALADTDRSA